MEELALGPFVHQHSQHPIEDLVGSSHALFEATHWNHSQRLFVFGLAETIAEGGVSEAPEVCLILGLDVAILALFFKGEVVVSIEQVLIELAGF